MKRLCTYKRISVLLIALAAPAFVAYAEPVANFDEETSEDQLVLPEVTTTVFGDSMSAGLDAVPDFTDIIPSDSKDSAVLLEMPGGTLQVLDEEPEADFSSEVEKNIYAQGLIGAGYPGYFTGDFSVYKSSGENPFLLQFAHTSAEGYGKHSARDGFFDSSTSLNGEKTLTWGSFSLDNAAHYRMRTEGLQGVCSPYFYDMNYQRIGVDETFKWKLPAGWELSAGAGGEWYGRYAGISDTAGSPAAAQEEYAHSFLLEPNAAVNWKMGDFGAGFKMQYTLETMPASSETSVVHRGKFGANFLWTHASYHAGAELGLVVGNAIGSAIKVIPPFAVSFGGEWRVGPASRLLTVELEGGLNSYLPTLSDSEANSRFTAALSLPSETSDWWTSVNASVPILSSFTVDFSGGFKKTAFGNGVWEGDYSQVSASGANVYSLAQKDRLELFTNIQGSYVYKLVTAKLFWNSHWGSYVPVGETPFTLGLSADIQDESSKWGADIAYLQPLGSGVDFVPVINAGAFYRVNDTMRITLRLDDFIKLCSATDRVYAGSLYIVRSGSATLLVRFFF